MGKWVENTAKFGTGHYYKIGKIVVGWVGYDGTGSREDTSKYKFTTALPCVRVENKRYFTESEAREALIKIVDMWFEATRSND